MNESRQDAAMEGAGPVFQPDTVLPSQFFAGLREKGYVEGEKRLMAAILADAVDCYMKLAFATEGRGRQLFQEAEAWIFSDEHGPWFFSFLNIADVLGLDTDYIRQGLLRWRRNRTAPLRPSDVFRKPGKGGREATPEELRKAVG